MSALPANETIAALAAKYPKCFSLLERRRKAAPLKRKTESAVA
jgi:hypothetical protein